MNVYTHADYEDNRLNEDEYVQLCMHTLCISLMVDYEDIGWWMEMNGDSIMNGDDYLVDWGRNLDLENPGEVELFRYVRVFMSFPGSSYLLIQTGRPSDQGII